MPVTHEINLNLSKYILPATVHMMQGDTDSRTVVATIWDGPVKYTPAEGVKPVVRFGKPDGTGGLYNKTETDEKVVLSGSKVTAPIARQVLTVPGIVKMQIELYEGDTKISAFPFQIHVIPSSKDNAEEISKDYADFSINYEVLGRYISLSELTTEHPIGKAGDAWFVGTESDNVVYQWDVDKKNWVNVGSMKGPKGDPGGKGDKGDPGEKGDKGTPGIVISSEEPTDPSHPVWIDPDGDETPDNPLDITGAAVGQIAKITAVDTSGKPTAWEAADLTEGDTWELINTFEVAEADAARVIKIDKDSNGNAFSLKKFAFVAKTNSTKTDASLYGWFCVNGRGAYNSGVAGFQTNFVRHPSSGAAIYNDVIGFVLPCGLIYESTTGGNGTNCVMGRTVTDVHEVELAGYRYADNQLYGTFQLWGVRK